MHEFIWSQPPPQQDVGGLSAPSVISVGFKESLVTEKTFLDYLLIRRTTELSNFMDLALHLYFLRQKMISYCYTALSVYI